MLRIWRTRSWHTICGYCVSYPTEEVRDDTTAIAAGHPPGLPGHPCVNHARPCRNTRPGGEPQSTPAWFIWDGQQLKFSLTTTRQKYRNLQRDPRLAVSLVDPQNPYRSLEIRGVARLEEDLDRSFTDALAQKYMDVDKFPYHQPGDRRITVVVEPQHSTYYGS